MKKSPLKFSLNEWIGAFGDIGIFVPLYLTLVALNGLAPGRSLFLVGIIYVGAAIYFRLPIPVQPLKAMAAIAIAQGLSPTYLSMGALWIGIILLTLVVTGKIEWLQKFFSKTIVKGIQLGVGLMLIQRSFSLLGETHLVLSGHSSAGLWAGLNSAILFSSFWLLVLPQLPLTLGNAVYAVSDVAKDYFGAKASRVTPRKMATSIGLSNVLVGFLGGLPVCHGSGGLTAHVKFGARTGGSTMIIGTLFILLAIFFTENIYGIFTLIPIWVLAAMIFYVGVCHVGLIKGCQEKRLLALGMGLVGLVTNNLAVALVMGLLIDQIPFAPLFKKRRLDEPGSFAATITSSK